jgi:hypothetical protein
MSDKGIALDPRGADSWASSWNACRAWVTYVGNGRPAAYGKTTETSPMS